MQRGLQRVFPTIAMHPLGHLHCFLNLPDQKYNGKDAIQFPATGFVSVHQPVCVAMMSSAFASVDPVDAPHQAPQKLEFS